MSLAQLPRETTASIAARRTAEPLKENAGTFDPDELCRRLELYKQQMRQAERLREARLEQGHKAAALALKTLKKEKHVQSSDDEQHPSTLRAQQDLEKRTSQEDTLPRTGLSTNDASSIKEPVLRHASYLPQSAAVDFAKTTTSDFSSRAKTLKRLSAFSQEDRQSLTEAKRRTSMREEAPRLPNGQSLGDDSEQNTFLRCEKRRPLSSMASLGLSHTRNESLSSPLGTNAEDDGMERWPSFEDFEPERNVGLERETEIGQDENIKLRGRQHKREFSRNGAENEGQLPEAKLRLTKRLSRMIMNVTRVEPRSETKHVHQPTSGATTRRRSSILGLFR